MDDAFCVRGLNRGGNLRDDRGHLILRQGRHPLHVLLEQLAEGPLDGQEVQTLDLADLEGFHHAGVNDAGAELGLPHEAGDGRLVLAQLLAEHLDRDRTVHAVVPTIDGRGSPLTNHLVERITCNGGSHECVACHGAMLTRLTMLRQATYLPPTSGVRPGGPLAPAD